VQKSTPKSPHQSISLSPLNQDQGKIPTKTVVISSQAKKVMATTKLIEELKEKLREKSEGVKVKEEPSESKKKMLNDLSRKILKKFLSFLKL
jgi:hypothetical protein